MVSIIEVILKDGLGTLTFECSMWKIQDGCLFCFGAEHKEASVFPLTSIVCFHEVLRGE